MRLPFQRPEQKPPHIFDDPNYCYNGALLILTQIDLAYRDAYRAVVAAPIVAEPAALADIRDWIDWIRQPPEKR